MGYDAGDTRTSDQVVNANPAASGTPGQATFDTSTYSTSEQYASVSVAAAQNGGHLPGDGSLKARLAMPKDVSQD